MPKDAVDFDQLYPSRFLKSGDLMDKNGNPRDFTLTISDVQIELIEGSKGKKDRPVVSFRETGKQWLPPKTCGLCLREMFGRKPKEWVGKRVTLFSTMVSAFGSMKAAIRVRGSPDIAKDLEFEEQLGLDKATFKVFRTGQQPANGNGRSQANGRANGAAPARGQQQRQAAAQEPEDRQQPPPDDGREPPPDLPDEPPLFQDDPRA